MNILQHATEEIIKVQKSIIGPVALDQARKVAGLTIDNSGTIQLTKDPKQVLNDLVKLYADFFGQASVEVCKDAVREITPPIPASDLPDILK